MKVNLTDGLIMLRSVMQLGEVMRLIEHTARWVDPATFRLLPLWYPEYARRVEFYKKNWTEPQMNKNRQSGRSEHKQEGNLYANKSLTHALGLRSDTRPNWSCCHLWGIDDALYQQTNAVVQDRRYYSCVANMVLLPTPLKAFTDTMPEVKAMLRICAKQLYGWYCDDESVASSVATIERWGDWSVYPGSWPRFGSSNEPLGVVRLNEGIKKAAERRMERIRSDLRSAGPYYPREKVRAVLDYWKIRIDP